MTFTKNIATPLILFLVMLLSACASGHGEGTTATLKGITLDTGELSPAFSAEITDYTVQVAEEITTVEVTPTPQHHLAEVEVNGEIIDSGQSSGPIALTSGANTIEIKVTSQDKALTQIYTLTVNRGGTGGGGSDDLNDASLALLVISDGALDQIFQSDVLDYTASVNEATVSTRITATLSNPQATLKINSTAQASGQASEPIDLLPGINTIRIDVLSANSQESSVYTLAITRQDIQDFVQQALLKAQSPQAGAWFGFSSAVAGNTLVIGSPREIISGKTNAGVVDVFKRGGSGWEWLQRLQSPQVGAGELFGQSVSLDGDVLAVGARGNDQGKNNSGAVYVFKSANGSFANPRTVKAPTPEQGHQFGNQLVLNSGRMAVSTLRGKNINNEDSGSVFIFARDGDDWKIEDEVGVGNDLGAGDFYGHSIDLEGDRLAVGSYAPDGECQDITLDRGSVQVYQRGGGDWTLAQELTARLSEIGDRFGHSVSLEGDTLAIGAQCEEEPNHFPETQGAVYIFDFANGSWTQSAKIKPADQGDFDLFGDRVVLAGNTLIATASFQGNGAGAAYVFTRNAADSWPERQTISASNIGQGDRFGVSMSLSGGALVIGAPEEGSGGENAGAAYVFE